MTGHIRKRTTKNSVSWQIILEKGIDATGKRLRDYITVEGTKKDAQRILTEKLDALNKGTYIEPTQLTVNGLLDQWLEVYVKPGLAPYTVRGYQTNIDKYIRPHIGVIPVQKLVPMQIQEIYKTMQANSLSSRTIRYVHTTLHEALQYAFKMQLIPRNPADFVSVPKLVKYKADVFEEDEVLKMLGAAKDTDIEAPLHLLVGLGLRRGELLALKWSDIDYDKKQLTVCRNLVYVDGQYIFKAPKSESGNRTIEMPASMVAILKKHWRKQLEYKLFFGSEYREDNLVCCRPNGTPYMPGSFSHKFSDFLQTNGLRQIRLHDLRHTNASLMLQYNVPAKVASQRLGHSSIGITLDLYSHVIGNLQTEAAQKIDTGIYKKLG